MSSDVIQMLVERLDRIENNLDAVRTHQTNHPACPSPGLCVTLSAANVVTLTRIERLENRILVIEKWQAWLMGATAIVLAAATLFGPTIRKAFKLE